jgi:hypothetical protein
LPHYKKEQKDFSSSQLYLKRSSNRNEQRSIMNITKICIITITSAVLSASMAFAGDMTGAQATAAAAKDSLAKIAQTTGEGLITRETAEKLGGDQLVDVIKYMQDKKTEEKIAGRWNPESVLVPIGVVGGFFLAVVLIVAIPLILRSRRDTMLHATLRAMIDKGVSIPPELLTAPKRPASDLRRGMILVATGLGVCLFFTFMPAGKGIWALGLIPLLIGAAYMVVWKLESMKKNGNGKDA